ncbi:MAG TPA: pentapeptide repeat-containing protein [Micromonosporaceae bacterium]|nr:pentapeptide repeat-containing protein [Micromonosporaceae bacterium]
MSDWSRRNARALIKEFQRHGLAAGVRFRHYRGEDLRGQVFDGDEDLTGADFRNADLTDARFPQGADLTDADLSGCRLAGAHLNGARLAGADLTSADLTRASLIGADLRTAGLAGATWDRARLTAARLPPDTTVTGWGTALPDGRARLELASGAGVSHVSWHPAGDLLAVARGLRVEIWDLPTGSQVTTLEGHNGSVLSVAWSPDGGRLASGGGDGVVRVWDPGRQRSYGLLRRLGRLVRPSRPATVRDHASVVIGNGAQPQSLAYSPDGRYLAVGTDIGLTAIVQVDPEPTVVMRLLGLPDGGWASFTGDYHYQLHGNPAGRFWWSSGLCRFEPGELDGLVTERTPG